MSAPAGAPDDYHVLTEVDRAIRDGASRPGARLAIAQQEWGHPALVLEELFLLHAAWVAQGGLAAWAPGWRVWLADGRVLDSRTAAWQEVPAPGAAPLGPSGFQVGSVVLGVRYTPAPGVRGLVQGSEPFWLDAAGLLHDSRTHAEVRVRDRLRQGRVPGDAPWRYGCWVPDRVMRQARRHAVEAWGLEGGEQEARLGWTQWEGV